MKGWGIAAAGCLFLSTGCASGGRFLPSLPGPEPEASPPPPGEWTGDDGAGDPLYYPGTDRDRHSAGLFVMRPQTENHGPAGANRAVLGRFEWTRLESGGGRPGLGASGVLAEGIHGASLSKNRRREERADEIAVWWTRGRITGARGDPDDRLRAFETRVDFLIGFRVVHFREEDGDRRNLLDVDRDSYTLPEFSIGFRLEWSPVERVVLGGRLDVGVLPLLVVNAGTFQAVAGIRVEAVRGVEFEAGWRYLTSAGGGIFDSASFRWDGPWAGVVVSF